MAQEAEQQDAGQAPADAEPSEAQEAKDAKAPETFDKAYVQQLRQEAARHRKEAQEAKARAQEYEDRDKSELEKLAGKVTKAERDRDEAKASLLRYEVAAEKQVPADALDLLVGNTREELESRADRIVELAKRSEQTPEFDGGARDPAPEPKTAQQEHSDLLMGLFGRQPNQ